jgi:hypothetical protein
MQHLMANTEFMSWPTVRTLSRVRLRLIRLRRNFIERYHSPCRAVPVIDDNVSQSRQLGLKFEPRDSRSHVSKTAG